MNTFKNNGDLYYPTEGGTDLRSILRQVYVWMGLGTLLTAAVAYVTVNTSLISLAANPVAMLIAIIAEFALVAGL